MSIAKLYSGSYASSLLGKPVTNQLMDILVEENQEGQILVDVY